MHTGALLPSVPDYNIIKVIEYKILTSKTSSNGFHEYFLKQSIPCVWKINEVNYFFFKLACTAI